MDLPVTSFFLFGATTTNWTTPLWMVGVGAGIAAAILVVAYLLLQQAAPKIAAIARTTTKEALSQPLFYVVLAIGLFALILFPFIPYNTFGEDIKMVKDTGLTLIMVLSIFLALWTASVSIADEIEGRTALTLLSKPITRRSFILGKFLGIAGPVAILFIVLGSLFLATVSYKVAYDARESGQPAPTREQCAYEMKEIVPGLVLAFLEAMVLTSISVAISTRLPMTANLVICMSVYVLGHLVPMLTQADPEQLEIVGFVGGFLATILPVLDHFNIYNSISTGQEVPWSYVGRAAVYCFLYSSVAMLVALLLFEDRDLA
ncbi:MAG: ABC transporter permease subunit [Thermoguttaceae bacterium]